MYSERKQIAKGVYLTNISADKFKSNYIQIRFVMPLAKDTAAKTHLFFPLFCAERKNIRPLPISAAASRSFMTPVYGPDTGSMATIT